MRTTRQLLSTIFLLLTVMSCEKEQVEVKDYSFPVTITSKGSNPFEWEITDYGIEESSKEDKVFFFCNATVPNRGDRLYADESLTFWAYFPELGSLSPDSEIIPVRVTFGYILTNNIKHSITGGKIFYRGMKDGKALIEFQDLLFRTASTRYVDDGKVVISGTMECPVLPADARD